MKSSCVAVVCLSASTAAAQWSTAIDRPLFSDGPTTAYYTEGPANTSTLLFNADDFSLPATADGFTGLAADDEARVLYGIVRNGSTSDLYALPYDTLQPTKLFNTTYVNSSSASTSISFDGLAFDKARGVFYGVRNIGIGEAIEGVWVIDAATGVATPLLNFADLPGGVNAYGSSGIAYDPATDTVYFVNADTDNPGVFAFDPDTPGTVTQAAPLDPQRPTSGSLIDHSGLAVGDGKLFMLGDNQDLSPRHAIYDLATQTFSYADSPYPPRSVGALGPINPGGGAAYTPSLLKPECIADQQTDGVLNARDVVAFVRAFRTGAVAADANKDGRRDATDLLTFVQAFRAGCD